MRIKHKKVHDDDDDDDDDGDDKDDVIIFHFIRWLEKKYFQGSPHHQSGLNLDEIIMEMISHCNALCCNIQFLGKTSRNSTTPKLK